MQNLNEQNNTVLLKFLMVVIACLLTLLVVLVIKADVRKTKKDIVPAVVDAGSYSVIVKNLSDRLKTDLADNSVTVELSDLQKQQISKNQIEIKGEGFCVIKEENNQLPIRFEAKLNTANQTIADIRYDFVESASEYAPTTNEEILMKELMKQISQDYKTESVVISIDGFETAQTADSKTEFKGNGEIKIGEVEWNKIKFDVVLNADKTAAKIVYDIQ